MAPVKCVIDTSPHAVEIAQWLRLQLTITTVNAHLKKLDPEHSANGTPVDKDHPWNGYSPSMLSRHRMNCLGMIKLGKGRVANKTASSQRASDISSLSSISNEEVLRVSKNAFFDRLKNHPGEVTTRELVSVISALSKGKDSGGGSEMDKLTRAMGDLGDDLDVGEETSSQEP